MLAEDIIYLLAAICLLSHRVVSTETCKSIELQDDSGIILQWSETPIGEFRPSTPMCIDNDEKLLQRKCNEAGVWEEFEPKRCMFFTMKQFIACPDPMEKVHVDDESVCVSVTEPVKWRNPCLSFGEQKSILDLSSDELRGVVDHIKTKRVSEFWLPARRLQDFNPFQWQLAGDSFGDVVDLAAYDMEFEDNYIDKCLKVVINGTKLKFKSENCEEILPEVCIYEDDDSAVKLGCKTGLTSRYFEHHEKCFTVEKTFDPKRTLLQATEKYSRMFMEDLMDEFDVESDDRCLVDLGSSGNLFTNASYGSYTVMNSKGKWSVASTFTCAIYEEKINLRVPEIYLKFDASTEKMLLIVYSEEFLWREDVDDSGARCFTIADNELVKPVKTKNLLWSETIRKYEMRLFDSSNSRDMSKAIYELKLSEDAPGVYWCEGHVIKTGQLIQSKKVIARKVLDSVVFAVVLKSNVTLTDKPIYDKTFLKSLTKEFGNLLKDNLYLDFYQKFIVSFIRDIRVVKIIEFDASESQLTAIYHVTLQTFETGSSSSSEEYEDFMEKYAEKFNDVKVLINHQVMSFLEDIFKKVGGAKFEFISIHSTEYCMPVSITKPNPSTDLLEWEQAFIGETLPPVELCVHRSGVPLTRTCVGDFLQGGTWTTPTEQELQCVELEALSLHTKRLFAFNRLHIGPNETRDVIDNMTSITGHFDQLIPADLFYISKAVQQLTNAANVTSDNLNSNDKYNLTIILNNIMNVKDRFIQLSQLRLNTTNILLDSYDNLINSLSTNYSLYATINNNLISNSLNETDGTFIMRTEKIVVFVCDPERMNVSGVALVRTNKDGNETSLNDYRLEKLYATQTIDDILNIYRDSLELASYFPDELLQRIDEIRQLEVNTTGVELPLKIVVKIYYNDAIFKESGPVSSYKSQSKIISVSLPGHDQNLPLLLPIMFKKSVDSPQSDKDVCGFWDFQPGSASTSSEWVQEGCEFLGISKYDQSLALCGCSHLTHFAYLITGNYVHDIQPGDDVIVTKLDVHNRALNTITLLGSSLSILGIIGIFITAINFRTWREKASTKVLLQLSLAIALQMFLFSFFSTERHTYMLDTDGERRACIILGSGLHYSVLVTFSWMFITAFLQFKRYVIVLGNLKPERFFLKSFLVGWGMPFLPIIVVLAIDPSLYIPETYGICYPQGLAFYFSVLLPVGLIVIANLIIFIMVIFSILNSGSGAKSASLRKSEQSLTLSQLRVSIFLFFLLGLTWIFGILAASDATILFSYLFCLTATLQGFVLFLYFIVMDPITRKLWRESFRSWSTRN